MKRAVSLICCSLSQLILACLLPFVAADSYFFPNGTYTADNNVSTACAGAIQAPINCSSDLMSYATADTFFPLGNATYAAQICGASCGTAFSNYVSNVTKACANDPQPWIGLPATYYGYWAWATWNLTCLQDPTSHQYCVDYLFSIDNATVDTTFDTLPASQICVPCVYKMFQQIQQTSFSNYDYNVAAEWAAVQSKCSVSYPTATQPPITNLTNIPNFVPANASYAFTPTCISGNTYTVVSGDNCEAIAEKYNVATGTLITLNSLLPDGSDLQVGQVLCLPQTCQTYRVQAGDTCDSIANSTGSSYPVILGYNPTINNFCTNLIAGRNICISPPGGAWNGTTIAGVTATQTVLYATSTVAPPGPTAPGTTNQCGAWYQVQSGDWCSVVALNQSISLSLFEAINPAINSNCSNLTPGIWYCVEPTLSWNATANATVTSSSMTYIPPPTQTPPGTTPNCYEWYTVQSGDTCANIEYSFSMTFAQFRAWNPSLNSNCTNLYLNEAYCVFGSSTATTSSSSGTVKSTSSSKTSSSAPKTTSSSTSIKSTSSTSTTSKSSSSSKSSSTSTYASVPSPTATGSTSKCYTWYSVKSGDTCNAIDTTYSITLSQFLAWNPSINSGCTNLQVGVYYCVNSPVQVSTTAGGAAPAAATHLAGGKRQENGQVAEHIVQTEAAAWARRGMPPKFPGQFKHYDMVVAAGK